MHLDWTLTVLRFEKNCSHCLLSSCIVTRPRMGPRLQFQFVLLNHALYPPDQKEDAQHFRGFDSVKGFPSACRVHMEAAYCVFRGRLTTFLSW